MQDILLHTDGDLQTDAGDLVIGYSDGQHQNLLLQTFKGEWKDNPTIAVGAAGFLKDEDVHGLSAEIKQEFERDGMNVAAIEITTEKISVDASY
jgi:hypothetical protein